jgi:hypothetical protein
LIGTTIAAQQAPVDLTGYWVAAITEDWRFRMVTPPKGDYASVPLNAEGTKAAGTWDPAKDVAAGEQCRAFGAAGIMRLPVRLHVTWQDAKTLKVEIDNGKQVRIFHLDKSAPSPAQAEWQGFSVAEWETVQQGQGIAPAGGGRGNAAQAGSALSGSLKAVLTEFFDRTNEPNGDSWLILTSIVDDPAYLQQPFMLTTHFKREPDGARFNPRPCEVTPPVVGTP